MSNKTNSVTLTKRQTSPTTRQELKKIQASLPEVFLFNVSFNAKFFRELIRHHRWLSIVLSDTSTQSKKYKAFSLFTQVLIVLSLQALILQVVHPKSNACEQLDSQTACLSARSYDVSWERRCSWDAGSSRCKYIYPDESYIVWVSVATGAALIAQPLALAAHWLVVHVLSAPILVACAATAPGASVSEREQAMLKELGYVDPDQSLCSYTPTVESAVSVEAAHHQNTKKSRKQGGFSDKVVQKSSLIYGNLSEEFRIMHTELKRYRSALPDDKLKEFDDMWGLKLDGSFQHTRPARGLCSGGKRLSIVDAIYSDMKSVTTSVAAVKAEVALFTGTHEDRENAKEMLSHTLLRLFQLDLLPRVYSAMVRGKHERDDNYHSVQPVSAKLYWTACVLLIAVDLGMLFYWISSMWPMPLSLGTKLSGPSMRAGLYAACIWFVLDFVCVSTTHVLILHTAIPVWAMENVGQIQKLLLENLNDFHIFLAARGGVAGPMLTAPAGAATTSRAIPRRDTHQRRFGSLEKRVPHQNGRWSSIAGGAFQVFKFDATEYLSVATKLSHCFPQLLVANAIVHFSYPLPVDAYGGGFNETGATICTRVSDSMTSLIFTFLQFSLLGQDMIVNAVSIVLFGGLLLIVSWLLQQRSVFACAPPGIVLVVVLFIFYLGRRVPAKDIADDLEFIDIAPCPKGAAERATCSATGTPAPAMKLSVHNENQGLKAANRPRGSTNTVAAAQVTSTPETGTEDVLPRPGLIQMRKTRIAPMVCVAAPTAQYKVEQDKKLAEQVEPESGLSIPFESQAQTTSSGREQSDVLLLRRPSLTSRLEFPERYTPVGESEQNLLVKSSKKSSDEMSKRKRKKMKKQERKKIVAAIAARMDISEQGMSHSSLSIGRGELSSRFHHTEWGRSENKRENSSSMASVVSATVDSSETDDGPDETDISSQPQRPALQQVVGSIEVAVTTSFFEPSDFILDSETGLDSHVLSVRAEAARVQAHKKQRECAEWSSLSARKADDNSVDSDDDFTVSSVSSDDSDRSMFDSISDIDMDDTRAATGLSKSTERETSKGTQGAALQLDSFINRTSEKDLGYTEIGSTSHVAEGALEIPIGVPVEIRSNLSITMTESEKQQVPTAKIQWVEQVKSKKETEAGGGRSISVEKITPENLEEIEIDEESNCAAAAAAAAAPSNSIAAGGFGAFATAETSATADRTAGTVAGPAAISTPVRSSCATNGSTSVLNAHLNPTKAVEKEAVPSTKALTSALATTPASAATVPKPKVVSTTIASQVETPCPTPTVRHGPTASNAPAPAATPTTVVASVRDAASTTTVSASPGVAAALASIRKAAVARAQSTSSKTNTNRSAGESIDRNSKTMPSEEAAQRKTASSPPPTFTKGASSVGEKENSVGRATSTASSPVQTVPLKASAGVARQPPPSTVSTLRTFATEAGAVDITLAENESLKSNREKVKAAATSSLNSPTKPTPSSAAASKSSTTDTSLPNKATTPATLTNPTPSSASTTVAPAVLPTDPAPPASAKISPVAAAAAASPALKFPTVPRQNDRTGSQPAGLRGAAARVPTGSSAKGQDTVATTAASASTVRVPMKAAAAAPSALSPGVVGATSKSGSAVEALPSNLSIENSTNKSAITVSTATAATGTRTPRPAAGVKAALVPVTASVSSKTPASAPTAAQVSGAPPGLPPPRVSAASRSGKFTAILRRQQQQKANVASSNSSDRASPAPSAKSSNWMDLL